MKRPLAAGCCIFVLLRLAASILPPAMLLPLAAVFVFCPAIIFLRHRQKVWLYLTCICFAALAVQAAEVWLLEDVFLMTDSVHELRVCTESVRPGTEDGMTRAKLLVTHVDGRKLPRLRRFRVDCPVFPAEGYGELYEGWFRLKALKPDRGRTAALAEGVYLRAECQELSFLGMADTLRFRLSCLAEEISGAIRRNLPAEEGAVLAAMTVGDRRNLPRYLMDMYRRAGVAHLLVVSGLHLNLLCGAFLGNRPVSGKHRRAKALLACLLVLCITMLTGANPSVRRAAAAAMIYYLGAAMLCPPDALTSLGIAAVLASFSGPYALRSLGLQLSFMATLGVILAGAAARPLKRRTKRSQDRWKMAGARLTELLLIPFMAAVFTLPVQLASGLAVSGVSVLTNLLITGLSGPILILGLATGLTGLIPGLSELSRWLALPGGLLVRLQNRVVEACGSLPAARLVLPEEFGLFLWLVLAVSIGLLLRMGGKKVWFALLYLAVLPGMLAYCLFSWGTVHLYALGSAASPALAVNQNQKWAVIFQGGEYSEEALLRFLEERCVDQVDLLIDLRKKPSALKVKAAVCSRTGELPENSEKRHQFYDIMATELNFKTGRAVLLDVTGCTVLVTSGRICFGTPVEVNTLLAGSTLPEGVSARQVVCCGEFDWKKDLKTKLYFAPAGWEQTIRPGFSIQDRGGSYAVQ